MAQDDCDERLLAQQTDYEGQIEAAKRNSFLAGRRAGVWLAFNGPRARAQDRRLDVQAMRRQDVALEGLSDVFGRAEEAAAKKSRLARIPRPILPRSSLSGLTPMEDQEGKYDEYARQPDVLSPVAPAVAPVLAPGKSRLADKLRGLSAEDIARRYTKDDIRDYASLLGVKGWRDRSVGRAKLDTARLIVAHLST